LKRILKKLKISNILFDFFISFSEKFFLINSKILEKIFKYKIFKRIVFNLQPTNKLICINTSFGKFLINTENKIISKKSFVNNMPYSANTVKKVLEILDKESIFIEIFVDVGANIGTTSISASFLNPNLNFVCIEGSKKNIELLELNVKLNNLENKFEIFNCAVGKSEMSNYFVEFKRDSGISRVFENNNEIEEYSKKFGLEVQNIVNIKTKNIDQLIDIKSSKNIFFWLDLEGLDLDILESNITKYCKPVIFEFTPTSYKLKNTNYKAELQKLERHLLNCGYRYFYVEVNDFKKEFIEINFLVEIAEYIGENKSFTNILII